MKRNVLTVFVISMLIAAGNIYAQTELRVNSFLNGSLNVGQEIWYSVRPAQSGLLTVETTNTNFDTYLEAYDAQRNFITDNDDYHGTNSLIKLMVQANTTYLFKLTGYGGYSGGNFRIMASFTVVTDLPIGGTPATGNISTDQEVWYIVRSAQAGYLIFETTAAIDTTITVYDDYFYELAYDDDGAGYPNARLRLITSPGRVYFVKVGVIGNGGQFRIQARHEAFPVPVSLSVGSLINGNISYGSENWYSIRAAQNGYLTVETTGNTETFLDIYDAGYNLITSDYERLVYPNSRVRINAVAGTVYIIKLTGNGGSFRIMADLQPYPAPVPLAIGGFFNLNITSGGEYWYSVRTSRSGTLIVETEGDTDTFLEAYDSSYNFITLNDDYWDEYSYRNSYNARIELTVQPNQTYIFMLRGYSSSVTGPSRIMAYIE